MIYSIQCFWETFINYTHLFAHSKGLKSHISNKLINVYMVIVSANFAANKASNNLGRTLSFVMLP